MTKVLLGWCAASAVLALVLGRLLTIGQRPPVAARRPRRGRRLAGGFVAASAVLLVVPLAGRGGADLAGLPPVGDAVTTLTSIVGATTTTTTSAPTTTTPAPSTTPSTTPPTTQPARDPGSGGPQSGATGSSGGPASSSTSATSLPPTSADGVPTGIVSAAVAAVGMAPAPIGAALSLPPSPVVDLSSFAAFSATPNAAIAAGPRSTLALLQMLEGLDLPPATLARILAPFPVAGAASYADDWGAPRLTPAPHSHQGVDVFADRGTPVIAAARGTVTRSSSTGAGGLSVRLTAQDGTYYYYAHLDRIAPGASNGAKVAPGDVLGFVGTTGNAEGGVPHLHFEIHPGGGAAVPPVPYLDRWLAEATDAARAVVHAPSSAVEALRQGRFTAAVGLPPRLEPLERAVAHRDDASPWPVLLVALSAVVAWRGWIWKLRRSGAEPPRPPAGFLPFD